MIMSNSFKFEQERANKAFISAKIKAEPFDYKLTNKLIFDKNLHNYNCMLKNFTTETILADLLDKKIVDSIKFDISNMFSICKDVNQYCTIINDELSKYNNLLGTYSRHNNIICNDYNILRFYHLKDFPAYNASSDYTCVSTLLNKNELESDLYLFLKYTAKNSLIPNLFFGGTTLKDNTLENLDELVEFKKYLNEDNEIVNLTNLLSACLNNTFLLASILLPLTGNDVAEVGKMPSFKRYDHYYHNGTGSDKDYLNDLYTIGIYYTLVYGAEILYHLYNTTSDEYKYNIATLFKINYKDNTFISDKLYKIESDLVVINEEVLNLFDSDNDIRFRNILNYADKVIKDISILYKDIINNMNYFAIPVFFAQHIYNAHNYAYQTFRVKYVTMLLLEAKKQNLLTKEFFNLQNKVSDESLSLKYINSTNDDCMLDLFNVNYDENEEDIKKNVEEDPTVDKSKINHKSNLYDLEMFKEDLNNGNYKFNIINVENNLDCKASYNYIKDKIKFISNILAKQIKEIKVYNTGGKENGLLNGKLDKKNLYKYNTDHKIFYKNNYKVKEMDLAFGCILDESGSMMGTKIEDGRIAMILLHETLNSLGINHSIIGHTSCGRHQSKINKYYSFREEPNYRIETPYSLAQITAKSGNCDSGALYYMQKSMNLVKNKDKIVLIFSDGQPTECTSKELIDQIKDMEYNGIHVIGIGINYKEIEEYYKDCANGKNLKDMINIIVDILKRYVLEKE